MDYLDHGKEVRERLVLLVGYVVIAASIAIATLVLVYQAYGFGIGKNGSVIQNGLIFFSSHPNPAKIYLNGALQSQTTDSRLILQSGIYKAELTRDGYRDWRRTIVVDGGGVLHYDYPFLFPVKLTSQTIATYTTAPGLATQSPDRRWLLVTKPGNDSQFDLYDLKNPAKPTLSTFTLPANLVTKATSSESWQLVGWADDNQHVLLEHSYDGKLEYILVDRATPSDSVNLSNLFPNAADIELSNDKYNNYYLFDPTSGELKTTSLSDPSQTTTVLQHVLAFKSYGNSTVLYVTSSKAPAGKVWVKLLIGGNTYKIRTLPAGGSDYLVNLTTYSGTLYVAVGSNNDNKVYIYQDPVGQIATFPTLLPVPLWVLDVDQPNYLNFSDNAQFIMTENGDSYGVYDLQNDLGYLYTDKNEPLDAPQLHATWMDGDRLSYVSDSKLIVQDYDNKNMQTLVSASPLYLPFFSTNYDYLFTLTLNSAGQYELNQTALLTKADL